MFESGSGSYTKGNDEFSFDNSFLAGGWVKKNLEYYFKKTKIVDCVLNVKYAVDIFPVEVLPSQG